jgi:hypothetical protein
MSAHEIKKKKHVEETVQKSTREEESEERKIYK